MKASLRALLTGLIDYAGMFPPARLPLAEAVSNYAEYRKQSDAWMLARFVCPAQKLTELAERCRTQFTPASPLVLSALGSSGDDGREFMDNLAVDIHAIRKLCSGQPEPARIDMYEVRLPSTILAEKPVASVTEFLGEIGAAFRQELGARLLHFYELPITNTAQEPMQRTIEAIAEHNSLTLNDSSAGAEAGFKLRCGGLEKAAFPSAERVAFCLHQCCDHQIPFKATAGLHHPVHHFDTSLQTPVHGFVNVFVAGVMAHIHRLSAGEIQEILIDQKADDFHFEENLVRWRHLPAPTEQIQRIRRTQMISFGSCSFNEPREDLQQLGWL